jgi:tetratricopeptide (TPR) repeat protein
LHNVKIARGINMKVKKIIFLVSVILFTDTTAFFSQTTDSNNAETVNTDATETTENVNSNAQKQDALKLYTAGNFKASIKVCQAEIAADPQHIDSYVVMCWALIANKEYAEADYWATEALKFAKYDQRIIESLAEAKFYQGKNDESLKLFQEYISLVSVNGSRLGDAYYFMGEIYIKKGMYDHADISFSQSVRTDPLYDYWWTRLGYAREMAGYYSTSLAAYEKALQLNSAQPDALRGRDRVKSKLQ